MPKRLLALALIVLPLAFAAAPLAAPPTNEVTVIVTPTPDASFSTPTAMSSSRVANTTYSMGRSTPSAATSSHRPTTAPSMRGAMRPPSLSLEGLASRDG